MAKRKCPICEGPSDESIGGLLTCEDENCSMSIEWVDPAVWSAIRRKVRQARQNERRKWKRKLGKVFVAIRPWDISTAYVVVARTAKVAMEYLKAEHGDGSDDCFDHYAYTEEHDVIEE